MAIAVRAQMTNRLKQQRSWLRAARWMALACVAAALSGCAVLSVGGAVVGAAITVTGAVVATGVELTGKAVGAGIDALSDDEEEPDNSGINIRYTERPASAPTPVPVPAPAPAPTPSPAPAPAAEPARPSPVR